eukprot:bmy_15257T0
MWGDNKKYRALRLDVGNFSWGSACCTRKTRITDIVYNTSNDELVHTKTLVQNGIMLTNNTWPPVLIKVNLPVLLHIKLDVMDVLIVPMENLLLMIVWTENPSGGKREN